MTGGVDNPVGGQSHLESVAVAHAALMNAYRDTLRAGDAMPRWAQRLVVHIVALSSRRAGYLLLTRVHGGRDMATETSEFAGALAGDDTAARLLRKAFGLVFKPFSSWESAVTTFGLAAAVAYGFSVTSTSRGAWASAAATFTFFAVGLSWVAGRLLKGRGPLHEALEPLTAAEAALFENFGSRQWGLTAPPMRILLRWGVPAGALFLLSIVLVCEGLWINRVVTKVPHHDFLIAGDALLAATPIVIFGTALFLSRSLSSVWEALRSVRRALRSLLVQPVTP